MFKTITPIDNTVYLERNYDSSRIDETISNSIKAQNEWSRINVKERVNLLQKFVQDFLSRDKIINEELSRQVGRPISQAPNELKGFKELSAILASNFT